ncbi:MAG: response regulator [Caldilineaceae bacterium]
MTTADPHPQTHPADVLGPGELNRTARLGTILVADADPEMRSDLQRLLQPHWQVAPAADGETALQIALEAPPDVILAAATLPRLDGVRLTQRVRASPQLADTPVILLTAQGDDEAAIQGLQAGADDAIAKPFSPRELLARIQGVYERGRARAALRASEARLAAEVAERTAQVRELATQLTMSEQEERRRISSLLHDDVQQQLFGMVFQLAALREALADGEEAPAQEIAGDIERALRQAIQVTRELSVDLSPPVLHDEGLAEALRWLAALMQLKQGLVVEVRAAPDFPLLRDDLRVLLFQTVRELLFNAVKHAGVQEAAVTLAREGAQLLITVRDEGRGFAGAGEQGGQGLRRIEQRMRLLGGTMEVAAAPGRGTCVTLLVPLEGEAGR